MEGLWFGDVGQYKWNEVRFTSLCINDFMLFLLYCGIIGLLRFLTAACTPNHLMESRLPKNFS
jgi:hypothetical protein